MADLRSADDFFFTITPLEEPEFGETHLLVMTEWIIAPPDETWPVETLVPGAEIERLNTGDPYGFVEAARESQAVPLEERLDRYAEMGL